MTYEITKHGSDYVLWKNVETEHGVGCFKVTSGSKETCQQKLEELNGTRTRKTKSKKRRTRKQSNNSSKQIKTTKKGLRKEIKRER